jgi:hypothetical protein
MKINWKALIALVLAGGTIVWAASSVLPSSYSGSNLNLGVGSGPVTLTNPSNEPVPMQFVGTGSSSFRVTSTIDGVSGSSTRQGTGRNTTNLFEFELPPGISVFTIARGTNVKVVATTATRLQATANPLGADAARTTLIVALVVVLGLLFYASKATGHGWMQAFRHPKASDQDTRPIAVRAAADGNQGRDGRMYSDI